jgi:hypothetical protein
MGDMRNVYSVFVGRPKVKKALRSRRRGKDTVRMDVREIRWEGVNWIRLAQDRNHWRALVNTVVNFRVP